MKFEALGQKLIDYAKFLSLPIDSNFISQINKYLKLLHKWNKVHNLTSIREISAMVDYHILDSMSIAPYLNGKIICDVGTGAGLPGIPLAILLPTMTFHLVESKQKKTSFLNQVRLQLNIENVIVQKCRVENFDYPLKFDMVISRAFASLSDFICLSAHLVKPDGFILAMKGKIDTKELNNIPDKYMIIDCISISHLRALGERNLILMRAR